jgi:hypothetical protein
MEQGAGSRPLSPGEGTYPQLHALECPAEPVSPSVERRALLIVVATEL